MNINYYLITTLTNLHAGSGDAQYGVIDNQVQKDVTTGLPTIHSSSLKGALRKYCENQDNVSTEDISNIFGADADENKKTSKAGKCKFLTADLLSRPVRSDKVPYFNATSPDILLRLKAKCDDFGIQVLEEIKNWPSEPKEIEPLVFEEKYARAIAEETDWVASFDSQFSVSAFTKICGDRLMMMQSQTFQELELPVIARNHLENGISKNLWYEEVMPADARFGFFIIGPEAEMNVLDQLINNKIVQIGANASIGYGLCKIERIKATNPKADGQEN